jgi:hypothetical protein
MPVIQGTFAAKRQRISSRTAILAVNLLNQIEPIPMRLSVSPDWVVGGADVALVPNLAAARGVSVARPGSNLSQPKHA